MKRSWQRSMLTVALLGYMSAIAVAAAKQTLTGEVGDAMCGAKHMEGTAAECTRLCVSKGSNAR